jgi:hypothetical protein
MFDFPQSIVLVKRLRAVSRAAARSQSERPKLRASCYGRCAKADAALRDAPTLAVCSLRLTQPMTQND